MTTTKIVHLATYILVYFPKLPPFLYPYLNLQSYWFFVKCYIIYLKNEKLNILNNRKC